jgi:DNA-binding transcriptional LysR family regulator
MEWDDVRVFLAVAQARSLSQGARQLGLDRSTASRRISGLERALGTRLFLRTRSGLRLSSSGERLLGHAERMAQEARALEAAAGDAGQRVTGLVRIATTDVLAAWLVRAGLLQVRARHPELEVELLGANRPVDLTRGEAELAVRLAPVKEPSLRVRRLARLPFALFAAEKYLALRGRPRALDALSGHEVLLPSGELAALPETKWLAARPGVRVALRTSSMTALLTAAEEGHGLAVIAAPWRASLPGLVRLFDVEALAPRRLWLVMHPDAATRAAVKVVAEHLAAMTAQAR